MNNFCFIRGIGLVIVIPSGLSHCRRPQVSVCRAAAKTPTASEGFALFGHLLVFAACHWLHLVAGAGVCRAAARERQGDCESQTKADFSEEVVFRFHNCVFRLLIWFFCSCERRVRKFISGYGRWLVRADVTHNSRPTFPRALRRRAWTETFADSGRCKSRTSFHRVRRGERLLHPRSFRRWGLWSRISILSWSCFFLGCCHGLRVKSLRAFQRHGANGSVESAAHECAQRIQLGERRRGEAAVRRAKTHLWREDPIAVFSLALRFVFGRGKHWITRLKNRAEKIQRLKDGLGDNERRGDLSRCHQGGATGVVAAVMRMRIV